LGHTMPQVGDESVACAAAGADRDIHTSIIGRGAGANWGRGRQALLSGRAGR
jgi:hypothetical protein